MIGTLLLAILAGALPRIFFWIPQPEAFEMPTTAEFRISLDAGETGVSIEDLGWDDVDANLTPTLIEDGAAHWVTREAANGDTVLASTGNMTASVCRLLMFSAAEFASQVSSVGDTVHTRFWISVEAPYGAATVTYSQPITHRGGGDYGRLNIKMASSGIAAEGQAFAISATECNDAADFSVGENISDASAYTPDYGGTFDTVHVIDVYQTRVATNGDNTDYEWAYALNGRIIALKQHGSFRARDAAELSWSDDLWDTNSRTEYWINVHKVDVTYGLTGGIEGAYAGIDDDGLEPFRDDSIVCLHGACAQVNALDLSVAGGGRQALDGCWDFGSIPGTPDTAGTLSTQVYDDTTWLNANRFGALQYRVTDPDGVWNSRDFYMPTVRNHGRMMFPIEAIGENGLDLRVVDRGDGAEGFGFMVGGRVASGTTGVELEALTFADGSTAVATGTGITLDRTRRYTIFLRWGPGGVHVVVEDRSSSSNTSQHIYAASVYTPSPVPETACVRLDWSTEGNTSDAVFYGPTFGRIRIEGESSYGNTTAGNGVVTSTRITQRNLRTHDTIVGRGEAVNVSPEGGASFGPFNAVGRSGGNLSEWYKGQMGNAAPAVFTAWGGEIRLVDGHVNYIDEDNSGADLFAVFAELRNILNDAGCVMTFGATPSPDASAWSSAKTAAHRDANLRLRGAVLRGEFGGHYFYDLITDYGTEAAATAHYFAGDLVDVHPGDADAQLLVEWRQRMDALAVLAPGRSRDRSRNRGR